jgi:Acetyltransferase (GNAT) domain
LVRNSNYKHVGHDTCVHTREIDPIRDPSWHILVERHPRSSVFHTSGWLEALKRTYGYVPFVLTTSPLGGGLTNGLVFCRVSSWLTGQRIVSVPFSDHCEPLVDDGGELSRVLTELHSRWRANGWTYIEIRPAEFEPGASLGMRKSESFCLHRLDLQPDLEGLFHGFHRDCIRRKIRRAEREGLAYEEGRSEQLLGKFYRLLVPTRRHQLLPPQPLEWFRNLIACMGDRLKIHMASKNGRPLASILTLRHKNTLFYKYGCSDRCFNNLGGTQLVFWKAIQEAKQSGLRELDMGRSEWSNSGLLKFKDRWGAARSTLTYWRFGSPAVDFTGAGRGAPIARQIFGRMPERLLMTTGKLLYRHVG